MLLDIKHIVIDKKGEQGGKLDRPGGHPEPQDALKGKKRGLKINRYQINIFFKSQIIPSYTYYVLTMDISSPYNFSNM